MQLGLLEYKVRRKGWEMRPEFHVRQVTVRVLEQSTTDAGEFKLIVNTERQQELGTMAEDHG